MTERDLAFYRRELGVCTRHRQKLVEALQDYMHVNGCACEGSQHDSFCMYLAARRAIAND